MFVLRSAFWLTVAFIVMAPHGTDLGATAAGLKDRAIGAGVAAAGQVMAGQVMAGQVMAEQVMAEQVVVEHVLDRTRLPGTFIVSSLPSVDLPMQVSPTRLAVVPRPRPAAMG